jgi:hypothetical protein
MLRRIFKRHAFFFAVVLTQTLGIGPNSAIFSVIDAILLKPLPYPGSRLVAGAAGADTRPDGRAAAGVESSY